MLTVLREVVWLDEVEVLAVRRVASEGLEGGRERGKQKARWLAGRG
jgi:(2Fe-2S) ferredoxin